jgi:hypothetical protein
MGGPGRDGNEVVVDAVGHELVSAEFPVKQGKYREFLETNI